MPLTITVRDETTAGDATHHLSLNLLDERLTVREIIRARVYQEVDDYNRHKRDTFNGLIQPTDTERTLNGFKQRQWREIDWKPQFEKACTAFEKNQVLLLIDDKQAESLDQEFLLTTRSEVAFVRLVPLVGG